MVLCPDCVAEERIQKTGRDDSHQTMRPPCDDPIAPTDPTIAAELGDMIDAIIIEHRGSLDKIITNLADGQCQHFTLQRLSEELLRVAQSISAKPSLPCQHSDSAGNIDTSDITSKAVRRVRTMPELIGMVDTAVQEMTPVKTPPSDVIECGAKSLRAGSNREGQELETIHELEATNPSSAHTVRPILRTVSTGLGEHDSASAREADHAMDMAGEDASHGTDELPNALPSLAEKPSTPNEAEIPMTVPPPADELHDASWTITAPVHNSLPINTSRFVAGKAIAKPASHDTRLRSPPRPEAAPGWAVNSGVRNDSLQDTPARQPQRNVPRTFPQAWLQQSGPERSRSEGSHEMSA